MVTLAPFRYARIFVQTGGPVRHIETGPVTVMGRNAFQANAYLKEGLRAGHTLALYGAADGTGTAAHPMVARHIAISEALERWAHSHILHSEPGTRYGFHVDPTSNGMAAFPGLVARQTRRAALREAVERYCLLSWWEGKGAAKRFVTLWPNVDGWTLENRISHHAVVLLHTQTAGGLHAYGTSAGRNLEEAQNRAAVELSRATYVLQKASREPRLPNPTQLLEKRCLFFATEPGYATFLARFAKADGPAVVPETVFDGPVPGPWSKYATVWRVVFRPLSSDFLTGARDYFFW